MNGAFQESQRAVGRLQDDFTKLDEMVSQHELVIPKLFFFNIVIFIRIVYNMFILSL